MGSVAIIPAETRFFAWGCLQAKVPPVRVELARSINCIAWPHLLAQVRAMITEQKQLKPVMGENEIEREKRRKGEKQKRGQKMQTGRLFGRYLLWVVPSVLRS